MGDRDAVCRFSACKGGNQQRAADGDERQGEQVQASTKAEFCDMEVWGQAGGQVVALQENVAGFGKTVVQREIRVIEAGRDGDHAVAP